MTVAQISPADWGARINYDEWAPTTVRRERIALHYNGPEVTNYAGGRRYEDAALRGIERFHLETKGWSGIAYSYAIGASGTVYRLRGFARAGAHAGDYDSDGIAENLETLAVLLILGGSQPMTPAMISSLEALRPDLEKTAGGELVLIGHREIAEHGSGTSTSCPGADALRYAQTHRRISEAAPGEPILGVALTTPQDALAWARRRSAHSRFLAVIPEYYDAAPAYGVRPEVGIVQASWETDDGRFGRAVTPAHHNWCGLKVTNPTGADDDPDSHARFISDRHGVIAHLEHLRLYADRPVPGAIDPRHFPWLAGTAKTLESLGGKWAPALDYGTKLAGRLAELLASAGLDEFPDGISPWAREAWSWARAAGILSEDSLPSATVTDERLAVFLHRLENPPQ